MPPFRGAPRWPINKCALLVQLLSALLGQGGSHCRSSRYFAFYPVHSVYWLFPPGFMYWWRTERAPFLCLGGWNLYFDFAEHTRRDLHSLMVEAVFFVRFLQNRECSLIFYLIGRTIRDEDTPESLGMQEDDTIDVFAEQQGGFGALRLRSMCTLKVNFTGLPPFPCAQGL